MWNGKKKAITFSFDDGVKQDVRLIEILNKYSLKGTFNLNSELLGNKNTLDCFGKIVSHDKLDPSEVASVYKGHEVAAHTLTHPNLTTLSEQEIITLASIVEREAVLDEERPKIAAVYLNRLKIGKRLEADPTVQYALGYSEKEQRHWKKGLTYADLKYDSPYNTYRYAGLPPAPIASPGLNSVKAVLNPEPDFDALYFVANKDSGRHIFSKTYHQHLQTIKIIKGK